MRVYLPMTCDILVVGHIRIIKKLQQKGDIIIGLLTEKALKGYKDNVTPYKDRFEILQALDFDILVVPQDTLNPRDNLVKYGCDTLASGDGFENIESAACKELGIKKINVKSGSKVHSSDIRKKC